MWSPDGTKIAFEANAQVFVVNADGTNQTQLTTTLGQNEDPTWSPDGTKIAFRHSGNIYLMNPDGTNKTRLTTGKDYSPTWSPDGTRIAYDGSTDSNNVRLGERPGPRIYVINADGTNPTRLTDDNNSDNSPRWSPPAQSKTIASNGVNVTISSNSIFLSVHMGNPSSILTNGPCHEINNMPGKVLIRINQSQ